MTRQVSAGGVLIGGGAPVTVQSMTNTPTADFQRTLIQTRELISAGCDIVRLAVVNAAESKIFRFLKDNNIKAPLVADIQFDYRTAIAAIENGADKIRINPGNIGGADRVKAVADCASAHGIPIRVGVNSGSIEKQFQKEYGYSHTALVKSAMYSVGMLEKTGFDNIVISVKSSNLLTMYRAYEELSRTTDYPLHLGVTEAGTYENALVKSSIGIGGLLIRGIGDTIRVSVTGDPVMEVSAARKILRATGLDTDYCEVISCPTCSRCKSDLTALVNKVEERAKDIKTRMKIAVMGCAVNGVGEAGDSDFCLTLGEGKVLLFKCGQILKTLTEDEAVDALFIEVGKALDMRSVP